MKRLLLIFALLPMLLNCQNVGTRVWRASGDNGNKPGIGFELRKDARGISGFAFLLDPDFPNDFSHTGLRRAMTVVGQSPNEISFRVAWNENATETLVFRFEKTDWPDSFEATVTSIRGTETSAARVFTFKRLQ
jgi:hypothetical protein